MIRTWMAVAVGAIVLGAWSLGCSSDQKSKEAASTKPLTYEESVSGSVTAKVKAIDPEKRVITLADDKGNEETFTVNRSVQRLDEVKPGDRLKLDYKATLTAELRPATEEEKRHPIMAIGASGRADASAAPAAGVGRGVRVVATVSAVDVPNMLVTLRGPLGDLAVVRGRKKENLEKIHVGDTIVITQIDTVAVSLVKAGE
jgi:hypothetical protein